MVILAYFRPAWSGGQGSPLEGSERVIWSRNYENPLTMLLPVTSGLLAPMPNPQPTRPLSLVPRGAEITALHSTLPTPRDPKPCQNTAPCWALVFQNQASLVGRRFLEVTLWQSASVSPIQL